ncbi:alpha/beta hydrolase [Bacillus sp. sid0103]|uniref:alpha/beta hydrolase n=1 Tax=Bacillus sp. sid0103 TaxID=2856337 RepID=UPI001C47EECE|nr:alpha/beta hydrolase [Bacillus sp. sid0103]MBV7504356.1 alpha/beta hydrolase [Bacillus sp. sid0103]
MEMEGKVNPELRPAFSALPDLNLDDLAEIRRVMARIVEQLQTAPHPDVVVSERYISGPEGDPDIKVRIYEPKERAEQKLLPGLLFIHGGGYIIGAAENEDPICYRFVTEANCVIVSVNYRLAPEHPFPAGPEDCYAALKWFAQNAGKLGVDPSRLAVAGASAGGGLTAAVSLLARDRQGPPIIFQMPLYPMIDDRNVTMSSYQITDKRVWCRDANIKAWKMYLGDQQKEDISSYAAPTRAVDMSGLPPTYTCVGELDPFRDETLDYVTRLSQAGVPTEFHLYPGCFHGFENLVPEAEISQRATDGYIQALRHALHST